MRAVHASIALGAALGAIAQANTTVPRRLLGKVADSYGSVSPDGRRFAFVDWTTGDLAMRDLASGEIRRLTDQKANGEADNFATESVFSPDGRTVAYNWSHAERTSYTYQLRLAGPDDDSVRIAFKAPDVKYAAPHDWTPDGKSIVTVLWREDRTNQIAIIPATGGTPRILKTVDWREPGTMRVSPDGRFLAYAFAPTTSDFRRDVFVMSLDGGSESVVAPSPEDDQVLGWAPGGRELIISSERSGSPGIYAVSMANGREAGAPRLLRGDLWRMMSGRVLADGSVSYLVASGDRDVYVASLDGTGSRTPPRAITGMVGHEHRQAAWSPDGKYVAFVTRTNNYGVGASIVTIRSLATGETRSMRPAVGNIWGLYWTPDAKALVLRAADDKGRGATIRLDLSSGSLTTIMLGNGGSIIAPDGRHFYHFTSARDSAGRSVGRVFARDLTSGADREVYATPPGSRIWEDGINFPSLALTRDGGTLLFSVQHPATGAHLMALPLAGGAAREIATGFARDSAARIRPLGNSADGRDVLFVRTRYNANSPIFVDAELFRVQLGGGTAVPVEAAVHPFNSMVLSPDGRQVAYTTGTRSFELWQLDGIASRAAAAPTPPVRR